MGFIFLIFIEHEENMKRGLFKIGRKIKLVFNKINKYFFVESETKKIKSKRRRES